MFRKVLIYILVSTLCSSAFLVFIHLVFDPQETTGPSEPIEAKIGRIYENFLHKTTNNLEDIVKSGTDYSTQDKVFLDLTNKMEALKNNPIEYDAAKKRLEAEIQHDQNGFLSFFQKISKSSPEEVSKMLNDVKQLTQKHNNELNTILQDDAGKTNSTSGRSQ